MQQGVACVQVLYGVEGLGKTGREGRFRKELEEAVGFPAGLLGALHGEALRAGHIVTGVPFLLHLHR